MNDLRQYDKQADRRWQWLVVLQNNDPTAGTSRSQLLLHKPTCLEALIASTEQSGDSDFKK